MASITSGKPGTGVYLPLLLSLSSAFFTVSLIFFGVIKSGSPAESEITSMPAAFISLAFVLIAIVIDSLNVCILFASCIFVLFS